MELESSSDAPQRSRPHSSSRRSRRRRQLDEAAVEASLPQQLETVISLAAFSSASARVNEVFQRQHHSHSLNDVIEVLRNAENAVYHRALAARALGVLITRDDALREQMKSQSDILVDALLQIINCCRHASVQNADTRRMHVNCCLVISVLMRAPRGQNLEHLLSLDSDLLVMNAFPSEKDSHFLTRTIAGHPVHVNGKLVHVLGVADQVDVASRDAPRDRLQTFSSLNRSRFSSSPSQQPKPKPFLESDRVESEEPPKSALTTRADKVFSRQFRLRRYQVVTPTVDFAIAKRLPKAYELPVISPTKLFAYSRSRDGFRADADVNGSLLKPREMLSMLTSKQMPVSSSADYFRHHLHDDDKQHHRQWKTEQLPPPIGSSSRVTSRRSLRSSVQLWETRTEAVKTTTGRPPSQAVEQNDLSSFAEQLRPSSSYGKSTHKEDQMAGAALMREPPRQHQQAQSDDEKLVSSDFKRNRLHEILALPVEPTEANTRTLQLAGRRFHKHILGFLQMERDALRRNEAMAKQRMEAMIEKQQQKLPLRFVFQRPGGAQQCRLRMQRAMALWILTFEDNQRRLAFKQWKAFAEQSRYRIRSAMYHRVIMLKQLRAAFTYIIQGYLSQGMDKWVETVQVMIWTDRDDAVRRIQRQMRRVLGCNRLLRLHAAAPINSPVLADVYLAPCRHLRFQLPESIREHRRRIWSCIQCVQFAYRRRRLRAYLLQHRVAAARIQAEQRMIATRRRYRTLRSGFIRLQAQHHCNVCWIRYQKLRQATCLVQQAYRSCRSRRLHRLVLCVQRREIEKVLTATLLLQRVARGFLGRREVSQMRVQNAREFFAALVFQRCWYRYNDDWSTFLLLGCLRECEREEKEFKAQVRHMMDGVMIRRILRTYRKYRERKRQAAALRIQCQYRRRLAKLVVDQLRRENIAHRRIKWFFRVHHRIRITMASRIQFAWLKAVVGRLYRHLQFLQIRQRLKDRQAQWIREYDAAARIQAMARGRRGRIIARNRRAARRIQQGTHDYVMHKRFLLLALSVITDFAKEKANEMVEIAVERLTTRRLQQLAASATVLQCRARGMITRNRLMQTLVAKQLRVEMATRIQRLWRHGTQKRLARKMLLAQKRRLMNPFRTSAFVSAVLNASLDRARVFFDPNDDLNGMSIPIWIRRLGLDEKYTALFLKKYPQACAESLDVSVAILREKPEDELADYLEKTIGINDSDTVDAMVTSLLAHRRLSQLLSLRRESAFLHKRLAALRKQIEFCQKAVQFEEADKAKALHSLHQVEDESRDFTHAPKALQLRRQEAEQAVNASDARVVKAMEKWTNHVEVAKRLEDLLEALEWRIQQQAAQEKAASLSEQNFKVIADVNSVARAMFLESFPSLGSRAASFAASIEGITLTKWQLVRFFHDNKTISDVKLHLNMLTYFALEPALEKYDAQRFQRSSEVVQNGIERVLEMLQVPIEYFAIIELPKEWTKCFDFERQVLQLLWKAKRASKTSQRVKHWHEALSMLLRMDFGVLRVQRTWRMKKAKRMFLYLRTRDVYARIHAKYLQERSVDHVLKFWQQEREKEKVAFEKWQLEETTRKREERLSSCTRFPYVEVWDDVLQAFGYWLPPQTDSFMSWRPVYTLEEDSAVARIQIVVRAFLAKKEVAARMRINDRERKLQDLRQNWEIKKLEGDQTVTFKMQFQERFNAQAALFWANINTKSSKIPLQQRRQHHKLDQVQDHLLKDADSSHDEQAVKELERLVRDCEVAYHPSVRQENRRDWMFPVHSRPMNAHGRAIVKFLEVYVVFLSAVSTIPSTQSSIRFTRMQLRFGWQEIQTESNEDGEQQRFYRNELTMRRTWDRPEYEFEDEMAALRIQSVARMFLGKLAFRRELRRIDFVRLVTSALTKAAQIGHIGFGLEGMNAATYLSRLGLSKHLALFPRHHNLLELLRLSDNKLKKINLSKEEITVWKTAPRPMQRKPPLSSWQIALAPNDKNAFNYLPSEKVLLQLLSQSYPNQQGRILGLLKAIRSSSTPVSYRQLDLFLRKYAGRPDQALENAHEIVSLGFVTQEDQEKQIFQLFCECVKYCLVCTANLKLVSLEHQLLEALGLAQILAPPVLLQSGEEPTKLESTDTLKRLDRLFRKTSVVKKKNKQKAKAKAPTGPAISDILVQSVLAHYTGPQKNMKGFWGHDATQDKHLSYAQLALFLREEALERILRWVRSCVMCQAAYRMHRTRRWYLEVMAFRGAKARMIQCAWRVYCARGVKSFLKSQQNSEYEQQYDKDSRNLFFVYKPTGERMNDEPRDHLGNIIAFRPMVQERSTKRWIKAWPSLDMTESYTEHDDDVDDVSSVGCNVCNADKATRRCNDCCSPYGDFVNYCFVCFMQHHAADNPETNWHTFTSLNRVQAPAFRCTECTRFSSLRCLQCEEHYCDRCFQRLHAKGKRMRHKCEAYEPNATVCIECEAAIAFQICLVCQDALCEDCASRTHAKGQKEKHELRLIKQTLQAFEVYCEQCGVRRGDTLCEFCSRLLCPLCLANKHGVICPETELKLKKHQLLGDNVCVECGKPADRLCENCNDRYCSVRWMGNPGCFEKFHRKGKRAHHTCQSLPQQPFPQEILELEERVRQKRRKDAQVAEQEAKQFAALLAKERVKAVDDALRLQRKARASIVQTRRQSTIKNLPAPQMRCTAHNCMNQRVQADIPFCIEHLTVQSSLELRSNDPLEAAKLMTEVEQANAPPLASRGLSKFLPSRFLRKQKPHV